MIVQASRGRAGRDRADRRCVGRSATGSSTTVAATPPNAEAAVTAGVVCATELASRCAAPWRATGSTSWGRRPRAPPRPAGPGDGAPALWLTFAAFPEMVERRRRLARRAARSTYTVVRPARRPRSPSSSAPIPRDGLAGACGDPVDLGCARPSRPELDGGLAGRQRARPARDLGGLRRPQGGGAIAFDDVDSSLGARVPDAASDACSSRAAPRCRRSRPGASVAVALGVEAELSRRRRDQFDVLYADRWCGYERS